jgi:hypothetical protein
MNYRSVLLVATILAVMLTSPDFAKAGSGGDGLITTFFVCKEGPNAGLECANDADCPTSECIETTILSDLFRCEGGANPGAVCTSHAECNGGQCVVHYAEAPILSAILTLIVDDYAHNFVDSDSCNRAATVMLEAKGRRVAQTYLCLRDDHFPELEFLRTEIGLKNSVDGTALSILNRLLFRGAFVQPDDEPELQEDAADLAQALRDLAGKPGTPIIATAVPVVVGTPKRTRNKDLTDHSGSGDKVASVLRLRVKIQFVIDPDL